MKKLVLALFAAVFFLGCATAPPKPVWMAAEKNFRHETQQFTVDLPEGWMRYNRGDNVTVTKEGFLLQKIAIERAKIDQDLKFTKKKLSGGMLPHELSEIFMDNMKSNPAMSQFELVENSPVEISGIEGFRLVFTYRDKSGLKFKNTYCGILGKGFVFTLQYSAPARYYYDRDVKAFEAVLKSFRLS